MQNHTLLSNETTLLCIITAVGHDISCFGTKTLFHGRRHHWKVEVSGFPGARAIWQDLFWKYVLPVLSVFEQWTWLCRCMV